MMKNDLKFTSEQSKYMVLKAVRMVGNALDLMFPSEEFKWTTCAHAMLEQWSKENVDYQWMLLAERDILMYSYQELVTFTEFFLAVKQ